MQLERAKGAEPSPPPVGDRSKCVIQGSKTRSVGGNGEDPVPAEGGEGPVGEQGQRVQEAWSREGEGSRVAWEGGGRTGARRRSCLCARKGLSSTLERSHVRL